MAFTLTFALSQNQTFELRCNYGDRRLDTEALATLINLCEEKYYTKDFDSPAELKKIGRELYQWLDGKEGWLRRGLEDDSDQKIYLDLIQTSEAQGLNPQTQKVALGLAHLPWELLHDGSRFLLIESSVLPVRKVQQRQQNGNQSAFLGVQNRPLRLLFMATSPEHPGVISLNFEQEEAKILAATEKQPLALVVEESGSVEELKNLVQSYPEDYFDVFHLTGHGVIYTEDDFGNLLPPGKTIKDNTPCFITEDDFGNVVFTTAEDLAKAFKNRFPRVIFLSGCHTGQLADGGSVPSMAQALVKAGAGIVLGWARPVYDRTGITAAEALYESLATGETVEEAVIVAHQKMLEKKHPDGHLLRIYRDTRDIQKLVTPLRTAKREKLKFKAAESEFLDENNLVKVASHGEFVGRRRALQRCLRALRETSDEIGVFIAGMGGLGKSSLAARLCTRVQSQRQNFERVVLVGIVNEVELIGKLAKKFERFGLGKILNEPEISLQGRLQNFFEHIEQELDKPLLLVLDDFEQNIPTANIAQKNDSGSLRMVSEAYRVLEAICAALAENQGSSRLIVTCRYLQEDTLPPHSLHLEKLATMGKADINKIYREYDEGVQREVQKNRIITIADGNPRLLKWLVDVVKLPGISGDELLTRLEAVELKFRENILAQTLLSGLEDGEKKFLARLSVFRLPVTEEIINNLTPNPSPLAERGAGNQSSSPFLQSGQGAGNQSSSPFLQSEQGEGNQFSSSSRQAGQGAGNQFSSSSVQAGQGAGNQFSSSSVQAGQGAGNQSSSSSLQAGQGAGNQFSSSSVQAGQGAGNQSSSPSPQAGQGVRGWGSGFAERLAKLVGLSLVESATVYETQQPEYRVTTILEPLLQPVLTAEEWQTTNKAATQSIYKSWWEDSGDTYNEEQAREIVRLAVLAEEKEIAVTVGDKMANRWVNGSRYVEALEICREILQLGEDYRISGTIARAEVTLGLVEEAMKHYQTALEICPEDELIRKGAIIHNMALLKAQQGDIEDAIALYNQSLEITESINDIKGKAETLHNMALLKAQQGDIEAAIALYNQSLQITESINHVKMKATTLHNMALLKAQQGDIEAAIALYNQSLQIEESINDIKGKATTLHNMAYLKAQQGDIEAAIALYNQSLEIEESINNVQGKAATLHNMANLKAQQGDIEGAYTLFNQSLQIKESINDVRGKAATLHEMAGLKAQQGDIEGAYTLYNQSLLITESINDVRGKATTLHALAFLKAQQGDIEGAIALYNQSLEITESINDVKTKAATLHAMAYLKAQQGDIEGAIALYNQSLQIKESINDVGGKAGTLNNMAYLAGKIGDTARELELYLQVADILGKIRDYINLRTVLSNLCVTDENQGIIYLAQAAWLCLRVQIPLTATVETFEAMYNSVPQGDEMEALLGRTAVYLCQVRGANHPQLEELQQRSFKILAGAAVAQAIETQEAFDTWIEQQQLNNPEYFIPRLVEKLAEIVGDGWLFERF
ncbi:tetratricopeptide repeat protein [Calothrix sp. 336/3]|uniref:tetratricopeptide repeat protein n=1 Tax=Calothrix sp. 336/3 TaxID=1337936 RepID=UPI000A9AD5B6|nr:tetratricopeptide repeat protein [Calothrix sp. 336/3]